MNLVETILKEHSKANCDRIVSYVGSDENRFLSLLNVFFNGAYRVAQRASWPISKCVKAYPHLLNPHYKRILNELERTDQHPAVRRNLVRLLQFVNIPIHHQGRTILLCETIMHTPFEPIAIKVFAMSVLGRMANEHPELRQELCIFIEDQMPFGSVGFVSRAKKVLRQLK